jgi:hypothetical protein
VWHGFECSEHAVFDDCAQALDAQLRIDGHDFVTFSPRGNPLQDADKVRR